MEKLRFSITFYTNYARFSTIKIKMVETYMNGNKSMSSWSKKRFKILKYYSEIILGEETFEDTKMVISSLIS